MPFLIFVVNCPLYGYYSPYDNNKRSYFLVSRLVALARLASGMLLLSRRVFVVLRDSGHAVRFFSLIIVAWNMIATRQYS